VSRPGSIVWLNPERTDFPDPSTALTEPNGLLAAGGDLSPDRLLTAYSRGIFPWYEEGQPILWWSPDPRCVLRTRDLRINRSIRRAARPGRFLVSVDQAFGDVVAGCSRRDDPVTGTWITRDMARAYQRLHELGHAHSIEVWSGGALAGGLYGVALGRMFFGESMFSRVPDASKIALAHLTARLQARGWTLIDCQLPNPHLDRLGTTLMPRSRFLEAVAVRVAQAPGEAPWDEKPGEPALPLTGERH
jgi:leucyl/phenylalanyl-tRNA--protein transferase